MKIEGIRNPEPLRDFLYAHMRGARKEGNSPDGTITDDETTQVLREIRDEVKRLRASKGDVS